MAFSLTPPCVTRLPLIRPGLQSIKGDGPVPPGKSEAELTLIEVYPDA